MSTNQLQILKEKCQIKKKNRLEEYNQYADNRPVSSKLNQSLSYIDLLNEQDINLGLYNEDDYEQDQGNDEPVINIISHLTEHDGPQDMQLLFNHYSHMPIMPKQIVTNVQTLVKEETEEDQAEDI